MNVYEYVWAIWCGLIHTDCSLCIWSKHVQKVSWRPWIWMASYTTNYKLMARVSFWDGSNATCATTATAIATAPATATATTTATAAAATTKTTTVKRARVGIQQRKLSKTQTTIRSSNDKRNDTNEQTEDDKDHQQRKEHLKRLRLEREARRQRRKQRVPQTTGRQGSSAHRGNGNVYIYFELVKMEQ